MGEVIQLQGDQRKDVQEFLTDKDGLELDAKSIKASYLPSLEPTPADESCVTGPRFLSASNPVPPVIGCELR